MTRGKSPDTCRSCRAPIFWARSRRNARMPIDPQPHPDGNLRIDDRDLTAGDPRALQLAGEQLVEARAAAADGIGQLYRTHFATCPNAEHHRRRPSST